MQSRNSWKLVLFMSDYELVGLSSVRISFHGFMQALVVALENTFTCYHCRQMCNNIMSNDYQDIETSSI